MSSRKLKVLLIGDEAAGLKVLSALASSEHEVAGVMTSMEDSRAGRAPLAAAATRLGYRVLPAHHVKDAAFADWVRLARVDVILNAHSLHIICDAVLAAASIGAFNMHPGPLPEYAGLNTVSWALYRGDTSYGVTVHWMAPRVDAGDIAYQARFPIEPTDTPLRLMHKCVTAGVPLAVELLRTASTTPDGIPRAPQNLARRQYFGRKVPNEGRLLWSRSAREIVNFVRACDYSPYESPWGHPRTLWKRSELAIAKAERTHQQCVRPPGSIGARDESGVFVAAADEWVSVQSLRIDGTNRDPRAILTAGGALTDIPRDRESVF